MITTHKIKDLGITLDQLYNEEKQISVHLSDKPYIYTLVLVGRDKEPDFMLSSFAENYYTRSSKGMNRQKYTTLVGIESAVKKLIDKHINTNGIVSFSLSDEINPF